MQYYCLRVAGAVMPMLVELLHTCQEPAVVEQTATASRELTDRQNVSQVQRAGIMLHD